MLTIALALVIQRPTNAEWERVAQLIAIPLLIVTLWLMVRGLTRCWECHAWFAMKKTGFTAGDWDEFRCSRCGARQWRGGPDEGD